MNFRSINTLKKKIDSLVEKDTEITIDHGVAGYTYNSYIYIEPAIDNNFTEKLIIYVHDFDKNDRVVPFMEITNEQLQKPKKGDISGWFVDAKYDPKYERIIAIKEYYFRESEWFN